MRGKTPLSDQTVAQILRAMPRLQRQLLINTALHEEMPRLHKSALRWAIAASIVVVAAIGLLTALFADHLTVLGPLSAFPAFLVVLAIYHSIHKYSVRTAVRSFLLANAPDWHRTVCPACGYDHHASPSSVCVECACPLGPFCDPTSALSA